MKDRGYCIYRSPLLDELMDVTFRKCLKFNRGGRPVTRQMEQIEKLPDAVENEMFRENGRNVRGRFRKPDSISGISTDTIIELLLRMNPNAVAYWDWDKCLIIIESEEILKFDGLAYLCRGVKQSEKIYIKAYNESGERITIAEIVQ